MANTGYRHYVTRKQVLVDPISGLPDLSKPTGVTEANVNDANYIPDELNYDSCPLGTEFLMSYIPINSNSTEACLDNSSDNFWHNGAGLYPVETNIVYEDPGNSIAFNGGSTWYKDVNGNNALRITSSGVVLQVIPC